MITLCGFRMLRCHACSARFVSIGRTMLSMSEVDPVLRKLQILLAFAAGTAVVLALALWMSLMHDSDRATSHAAPPSGADRCTTAIRT